MQCFRNFATLADPLDKCRNECKKPCQPNWSVEMSQSSVKFVGSHNLEKMSQLWTDEELTLTNPDDQNTTIMNLIYLSIFYPTMNYFLFETSERNPLLIFISNIGGQLSEKSFKINQFMSTLYIVILRFVVRHFDYYHHTSDMLCGQLLFTG